MSNLNYNDYNYKGIYHYSLNIFSQQLMMTVNTQKVIRHHHIFYFLKYVCYDDV